MQSLARAIKRGNAVMYFNQATKQIQAVWKRGTEKKFWKYVLRKSKVKDATEEQEKTLLQKKGGVLRRLFGK